MPLLGRGHSKDDVEYVLTQASQRDLILRQLRICKYQHPQECRQAHLATKVFRAQAESKAEYSALGCISPRRSGGKGNIRQMTVLRI